MTTDRLAPNEPLTPELVLVLPPALRLEALARLGPPVWPTPRATRPVGVPAPSVETFARSVGAVVLARAVPLAIIFVLVTIATLVLSLVAQATR